jgi:DNA (cytosine-5)-methyltransferase 1
MTQDVTGYDFFCGAGGTTTGAKRAGVRMLGAANHWDRAIETHNTNHPDVDHFLGNISDADMDRFPKVDILFASPECRTHSSAYGKKRQKAGLFEDSPPSTDEEERSRATMWDVCRYAERHSPAIVIVENVVEIIRWLYHGELYEQWLARMHSAGYLHREVFLNSMIAWPTPQSRDRIYVVFWKKDNRAPDLDIHPWCWCPRCEKPVQAVQSWKNPMRPRGKYRQQYVYRCPVDAEIAFPYAYAAATAIDWALPAPRIGDRARALAPATMARIRAGLDRFGPEILVAAAGNTWERRPGVRAWPVDAPIPTQATTAQHALVVDTAFLTPLRSGRARTIRAKDEPLATIVADGGNHGLVETHVRPSSEPFATQTARQTQALVMPMNGGESPIFAAEEQPLPTMVATCPTQALLVPAGGTWNESATLVSDPMRARTTRDTEALVVPLRTHGKAEHADVAPFPTVVAGNAGHALLMRNYRGGAEMTKPISEPTGTVTAVDHHALLVPYFGTGRAHPTDEPMGTVDTRDRRALVLPDLSIDDCGFRMLEPHEIKRAMAFPQDYKILGNKREQTRQCGNAVTPPASDVLTQRCVASLA